MMRRPYRVLITSTVVHSVTVDARTPEEAEVMAEAYLEEGDFGEEVERQLVSIEVEPVDIGALGEIVEEDN
jgi:hypothetical protein